MLVTGATGQLGSAFLRLVPGAVGLSRTDLDLTDTDSIAPTIRRHRPDLVIHCAAFTAVDAAEEQEDLATLVNGRAVGAIATVTAELGIPLVTFSTDYVFDGTSQRPYVESDPISPINAYGRSKAAGEAAAAESHPRALIVRTSWLLSGTHPNFVATILDRARSRPLRVVDDQRGCPTIAADLAVATMAAVTNGASGVLHLVNQGASTWYELAREAVALAGLDPDGVSPCATEDFPRPAARPARSILGSERLDEWGLDPLPPWKESLPHVVEAILARW